MSDSHDEVNTEVVVASKSTTNPMLVNKIVLTKSSDSNNQTSSQTQPVDLSSFNANIINNQEPWDNVYKLLQQLTDLREANSKLRKKVQFMEGMKLLTKLHQEIRDDPEFSEFFSEFLRQKYNSLEGRDDTEAKIDDEVFIGSDNATNTVAVSTTSDNPARSSANKLTRASRMSTLARERSKSVGHEEISNSGERTKVISSKSKRFPRWSRVKTALGWDTKANQSVNPILITEKNDAKIRKSQNEITAVSAASNASGSEFVNCNEYAEIGDELDKSFKSSGRGGSERRISGIKSIISSRKNSLNHSSIKSRNRKNDSDDSEKRNENDYDDRDASTSQISQSGISITLGSGIKGSKSLGDISSNSHSCSKYLVENLNSLGENPTLSSSAIQKSTKTKTRTPGQTGITITANTDSIVSSSQINGDNTLDPDIDASAISKYAKSRYRSFEGNNGANTRWTGSQRMPSMSPPVKRRSKWIKMRKVFANASEGVARPVNVSELNSSNAQSVPASPMSSDTSFNYVMAWNETGTGSGDDEGAASGYEVTFDNERRLKDAERSDDGEADYMLPLSESATEPVLNLVQQLQRNLSEDFRKKIEEWERIKASEISGGGSFSDGYGLIGSKTSASVKVERKPSLPKLKKRKSDRKLEKYRAKYKDLNWVEKELSRASKEKEKLDRERAKFEERIKVLQKCKEDALATEKGTKKEVLVRTSEGEFRFEGITDDFTKKLYEWETKKGLCPEASVMALLDSSPGPSSCTTLGSPPSLEASMFDQEKPSISSPSTVRHFRQAKHPLNRCISRSESSLLDPQNGEIGLTSPCNKDQSIKMTSSSLPSLQQAEPCSEFESILLPSGVTNENMDSRRAHLMRQQQQVARQLFNLETSSEFQPATIPAWGDGEKCMVTVNPDGSTIIVGSKQDIYEMTKEILGEAGDEGYISLLEANMFLLEKLNAKEDVCHNLEMQLKQLDAKMAEMNERHKIEMEKYREKLWEVHGNKSSNTEDSDKVIGELKERVEKLQLCSERLRADKEAIEDSFQYHSEQQAKLAVELIGKMRNLQEISVQTDCDESDDRLESVKRAKTVVKCCPENVVKLNDLSTRLLEKARELESALIERTRQICQLRWELLNREVSAMKLKTEMHSSQLQDGNRTMNAPSATRKRSQYGQRRSWSSSERLNYKSGIKGNQSGLDVDSWIISEDWPKIQKESSELSETVQQLKMELLKLASQGQSRTGSSSEYLDDGERMKIEGIKGIHELFASPLMADLIPSDYHDDEHSYSNETKFTSRHNENSGDNASCFSGPEGSESSSLNDAERTSFVLRLPRNRWRRSRDNVSSSSESSFKEEESFTAVEWCRPRTNSYLVRRAKPFIGSGKKVSKEQEGSLESQKSEDLSKEMVLSYGDHSISRSSSELTDQRNDSWGELYKHRLFSNQFSETSSSAYNEGLEESSSASMSNPFQSYYDTPDSTQSNFRSSSSSGHDRYIGIPMIDEDYPSGSVGGGLSNLSHKGSEFQVIPEGQVMSMAGEERRHSEPCRKFKYSIRSVNRNLVSNSAISIAEVKEDQSPSPVVYTIRLSPSRGEENRKGDNAASISKDSGESAEVIPANEYILREPTENIFFTPMYRHHSESPSTETSLGQEKVSVVAELGTEKLCEPINSVTNTFKTDLLEPMSTDKQMNRSPSLTSLTSLSSERSIIRSRTSQDSQASIKEKDTEIIRSPSKGSLSSKVASFLSRRSRSKSRSRGESVKQSTIGLLCKQSLALTVDPDSIRETTTPTSSSVTDALKSAATTATATISMSPSMSSLQLLPSLRSSPSTYTISAYDQFQSDYMSTSDGKQIRIDSSKPHDETFLSSNTIKLTSSEVKGASDKNNAATSSEKEVKKSSLLNIFKSK